MLTLFEHFAEQVMQEEVILTCALAGRGPVSGNLRQPETQRMIADSALEAGGVGTAILCVNVWDPEARRSSGELSLYEETVGQLRELNGQVILNLTTGLDSGFLSENPMLPEEPEPGSCLWTTNRLIKHVPRLKPEICNFDLKTVQTFGSIVFSTEQQLSRMATLIRGGFMHGLELFDSGDLVLAYYLIKKGALDRPRINFFFMGLSFAIVDKTRSMLCIRDSLPRWAQWTGFGIERCRNR